MNLEEVKSNMLIKGISERSVPNPGGSYVAVNVRGNIAYVAIQFPIDQGILHYAGKLGAEVTTIEGYQAARIAAMNILGQIEKHLGFEKIEGLNHLDIYYAAHGDWNEAPKIADGASDLFLEVLGEAGKHTRALFGVERLPGFACVGMTGSFTVVV
jgi:enamine deaminase RidA (YjgF/YER057c/UK114 family)